MRNHNVGGSAITGMLLLVGLATAPRALAQEAAIRYPTMAPVDQYLMADRDAEVALARSAAPASIARDAEVQVLGRRGFETAVRGTNGFVCIVGRSWTSAAEADYWDPKVRVPMCMNAAAARSYLVRIARITTLALQGRDLAQVSQVMAGAVARSRVPPMEAGAMCYMMSKEGYGGDSSPHWPSHLMFFYSRTDPASWGANQPGSPVLAVEDPEEQLTQFAIATQLWSDGTEASPATDRTTGDTVTPQPPRP